MAHVKPLRSSQNGRQECDHTSVGMLVWRVGRLLLIERRRPPYGYAPPAGHVDDRQSFEAAARAELEEEVGLRAESLKLLVEGRKDNPCRRVNGTWHYWRIYLAEASGDVKPSQTETKRFLWCSVSCLTALKTRTDQYLAGEIDEATWVRAPGLEPVWREWLSHLNYFD